MADFSGLEEFGEGGGDFVGVEKVIGAVEEEAVEGIDVETMEGGFGLAEDVGFAEIVADGVAGIGLVGATDAAIAGEERAIAETRLFAEEVAVDFFAGAVAVDVGVIEVGVAGIVGGEEGAASFLAGFDGAIAGDAHAAVDEAGGSGGAVAEGDGLHRLGIRDVFVEGNGGRHSEAWALFCFNHGIHGTHGKLGLGGLTTNGTLIDTNNGEKKKLKVIVKIFGRGAEVELNFIQVEKK